MRSLEQPPHTASYSATYADAALVRVSEIRPPDIDDRLLAARDPGPPSLDARRCVFALVALMALSGIGAGVWHGLPDFADGPFSDSDATQMVVNHIIRVESNDCATATNSRSSAAGPAQFIEATWLRMIRKHRPELAKKPRSEILAMRSDRDLSREMAARFAEQNARVLDKYGFPITSGTLYLSHFAGVAGAIAILSAPDAADAALTMANADVTGRITRGRIVDANPFLEDFTVSDLKDWADRKMRLETDRRKIPAC